MAPVAQLLAMDRAGLEKMSSGAATIAASRPQLIRVAYRMLGSMADAEDIIQDAWLRWSATDFHVIRVPEAFLRRVVTRLCLDHLKSARVRREEYLGPWLPDPVVEPDATEDVTLPRMLALERLPHPSGQHFCSTTCSAKASRRWRRAWGATPLRAVNSRVAREHVRTEKPRFPVEQAHGMEIAQVIFAASRGGEVGQLGLMLANDVSFYSDGGGKRPAAGRVMTGPDEVTRSFAAIGRLMRGQTSTLIRYAFINGLQAFLHASLTGCSRRPHF